MKPADGHKIVSRYNQWLQETEIPKILFYANPGAITNASVVDGSEANLKNLETVLGHGIYYLQEDHPGAIGKELTSWIHQQKSNS